MRTRLPTIALGVLVVVISGLSRLMTRPTHLWDGEGSIPATIGRAMSHGHWLDIIEYQFIPYQGHLVLDPLLSGVGYRVFGDQLLAWHWVGLFYLAVVAGAGSVALERAVSRRASLLWLGLLAVSPFVLRDSMVVIIGGHASAVAFSLVALALALGAPPLDRRRAWAAGAVVGVGFWYARTTVIALPAVLLAAGGGWRTGRAVLGGSLVGPALIAVNAVLQSVEGPGLVGHSLPEAFAGTFWNTVLPHRAPPSMEKLLQVVGAPWRDALYGRPPPGGQPIPDLLPEPLIGPMSRLWSYAWASSLLLCAVAWRFAERRREAAAISALALTYAAVYVLAPLGVEDELSPGWPAGMPVAVSLNGVRYLAPILLLDTLVLALVLGTRWPRRWMRGAAGAGAAVLLACGAWISARDVLFHAEPPQVWVESQPFWHEQLNFPGRGPSIAVHAGCLSRDEVAQEAHLASLARWLEGGPEGRQEQPNDLIERLLRIDRARPWTPDEQRTLIVSLGRAMAEECLDLTDPGDCMRSAEVTWRSLTTPPALLGVTEPTHGAWNPVPHPDASEAYARGFAAGFEDRGAPEYQQQACASRLEHPLCARR